MSKQLNFKEFIANIDQETRYAYSDVEVANMYFHNSDLKVQEISEKTARSIPEIYRIIHQFGTPNRLITNHDNVRSFADAGMPIPHIAELTGYSTRNVRYILNRSK